MPDWIKAGAAMFAFLSLCGLMAGCLGAAVAGYYAAGIPAALALFAICCFASWMKSQT